MRPRCHSILVVFLAGQIASFVPAQDAAPTVLTERTARYEHEAKLEGDKETFGAEHNPTGNPIGGGKGYKDILAKGDCTVRTLDELREALKSAKAGQVIFLPGDVQIDMSGQKTLSIPGGVTIASTRGAEGSEGALLFSKELSTPAFFSTAGDCVRITGLRLKGPYPEREPIAFNANGLSTSHFGFEVDNCELSGFGICAIGVGRGASRVYVHHNFIHHNQRSGYGYGVSIGDADVLIEANLFDWCRHHIACSGGPGAGYEARYNICLKNSNSSFFDMHGGRDRGDGTDIAGDWINIHHNTFADGDNVKLGSYGIRGVPSQGAKIHHNWFQHPDPSKSGWVVVNNQHKWLSENESLGTTRIYSNVYGPDRKPVEQKAKE